MTDDAYIQIYWTCGSLEEAKKVARSLVEKRWVACAQIIPEIQSVFLWKDQIDTQREVQVIFKTKEHHFEVVKEFILKNAQYEVPEILMIKISGGSESYLRWMDKVL